MKYKELTNKQIKAIESEVKMMLHAHRDCLRNRCVDTTKIRFNVSEGYYGEAFGIMRALAVLGYGYINGAVNTPQNRHNLRWWLSEIEDEALREEGYGGDNKCDYCLERYGKDHSRKH